MEEKQRLKYSTTLMISQKQELELNEKRSNTGITTKLASNYLNIKKQLKLMNTEMVGLFK